jgi:hypothetical protein
MVLYRLFVHALRGVRAHIASLNVSFHGAVRVSLAVIYALSRLLARSRRRFPGVASDAFVFIYSRALPQYLSRNKRATLYHSLSDLCRSLAESCISKRNNAQCLLHSEP